MVDDRKRMSKSLEFILWRKGIERPGFTDIDVDNIKEMVKQNYNSFKNLYRSKDPTLVTHLLMVLGTFYTNFVKTKSINIHTMPFYCFVDLSLKFIDTNP